MKRFQVLLTKGTAQLGPKLTEARPKLLLLLLPLLLLLLLLLDSTRLDIRIKSQGHDCNGKAGPKEPQ